MMMTKGVNDAKSDRMKYWKLEREYMNKAKEAFMNGEVKSPMCRKCFYDDYQDGKVKDWKEYCNMKKVSEEKVIENNPKFANHGKVIGHNHDFECENGHGMCMFIPETKF